MLISVSKVTCHLPPPPLSKGSAHSQWRSNHFSTGLLASLSHTSAHLPLAPRDLPQPIQHGFGGDPEEYDEEAQRLAFDEEDGEAVVARFSEDERAWMREEERNGRA